VYETTAASSLLSPLLNFLYPALNITQSDCFVFFCFFSLLFASSFIGGKEVIEEYLERTKLDVMESEKYLREILGYLKLEPLPPSKNP
jgi:hypothetical protein